MVEKERGKNGKWGVTGSGKGGRGKGGRNGEGGINGEGGRNEKWVK